MRSFEDNERDELARVVIPSVGLERTTRDRARSVEVDARLERRSRQCRGAVFQYERSEYEMLVVRVGDNAALDCTSLDRAVGPRFGPASREVRRGSSVDAARRGVRSCQSNEACGSRIALTHPQDA